MTFANWTAFWALVITFIFTFSEIFGKIGSIETKQRIKNRVTRATGKSLNWSEVFINLFDRIYRPAPNWGFYGRSALSSIIVVAILILVGITQGGLSYLLSLETDRLLRLLFIGISLNIMADVLSLAQTRLVLAWLSNRQTVITTIAALLLDFALTVLIMFAIFKFVLYSVASYFDPLPSWYPEILSYPLERARNIWSFLNAPVTDASLLTLLKQGILPGNTDYPLPVFLYSTFFTTVWIWLFSFSWLLSKSLYRIGNLGAVILGFFGFAENPIRAMGLLSALFLLLMYFAGGLLIFGVVPLFT